MNREEHKERAVELLAEAEKQWDGGYEVDGLFMMMAAQVHATLASTELVPMPKPAPRLCTCPWQHDPHIWGASCPRPAAEQVAAANQARAEQETERLVDAVMKHSDQRHLDPFEPACHCGANNGRVHDRRSTPGCLTAVTDGPGQL